MKNPELKITEDGSHTLYVPEIDECYHSTHGAIQESKHIFIDAAFLQCDKNEINVLEIGFGTALNAFLTLLEAEKQHKTIKYTSIELFPLELNKSLLLNYPEIIDSSKQNEFEKLHISQWNMWTKITSYFFLKKIKDDFTKVVLQEKFDIIYFDAFSPEKQPEMWTEKMFEKLYVSANKNAILTTYCCKGSVKRAMKTAGFSLEKIPGPIGKREILRARVTP